MQALIPIENADVLQLTGEDKLRIGIAWKESTLTEFQVHLETT